MKNSTISFCLLLLLGYSTARPQIPNAGFETWSSGNPTTWLTSNVPSFATNVTQSATARSGSSAVRGEVVTFSANAYAPILQSGTDGEGFPVSQRYATVSGYYQFSPAASSGDRFGVNAVMYKNGTAIAVGAIALSANVSSYTQFTATFSYTSGEVPDTCIIQLTILGPTGSDYHVGSFMLVDDLSLSGTATSAEAISPGAPQTFALLDNYPNPFNPSTTIEFSLAANSFTTLKVYNALGREVRTILSGELPAGTYKSHWNADDLSSGVYFYRLQAGPFTETKKLILLR